MVSYPDYQVCTIPYGGHHAAKRVANFSGVDEPKELVIPGPELGEMGCILFQEGRQGTTVQLLPPDERSSVWGSLPENVGHESHDLGNEFNSERDALQHKRTQNTPDLPRSGETCGDHAEGSRRDEANLSAPRIYRQWEFPPDKIWVEHNPRDFFDGLTIEPPSLSQEEEKALGSATEKGMKEFPHEADVFAGYLTQTCNSKGDDHHHGQENPELEVHEVAPRIGHEWETRQGCLPQTSERILIVSTVTDQILRPAAFRTGLKRPHTIKKNGLWEPKGPRRKKDEFSRLTWDRGKPDKGPVEGEVRLVIAPMLIMHVGVLSQ